MASLSAKEEIEKNKHGEEAKAKIARPYQVCTFNGRFTGAQLYGDSIYPIALLMICPFF